MNFSKVKPMLNRVLIRKLGASQKTSGGIILPNQNKNTKIGCVVEVGTGKLNAKGELIKPSLSVGQYVMLPEYGGYKLPKENPKDESELYIFQEEDIVAVVEGDFEKL
jgi:chaperonin GroES